MKAYMVKATDAGLLPWTFATTETESKRRFTNIMGTTWKNAIRGGYELVPVTVIENGNPLSAFGILYGN